MRKVWVLNTSNKGKLREFVLLFAKHGASLVVSEIDLKEIEADPVSVVVHKAAQAGEEVLVEDTSLEIEGENVGINVRWMLDHLSSLIGKKAVWRVLLAYLKDHTVYVYEGKTEGTIVSPRGEEGFGFDPVFLPHGSKQTLAEAKPLQVDARAKAVSALFEQKPLIALPPITDWRGPWQ